MSRPAEEYQTQNSAIATMLHTLGVPWIVDNKGNERRVVNIYTADKLREHGYRGMTMKEAARQAVKDEKHGMVVYNFQATPLQKQLCEAWGKIEQTIIHQDDEVRTGSHDLAKLEIDPEAAAAILCQYAKNRKHIVRMWMLESPLLMFSDVSKASTNNGGYEMIGRYKVISVDASPEVWKRLGL